MQVVYKVNDTYFDTKEEALQYEESIKPKEDCEEVFRRIMRSPYISVFEKKLNFNAKDFVGIDGSRVLFTSVSHDYMHPDRNISNDYSIDITSFYNLSLDVDNLMYNFVEMLSNALIPESLKTVLTKEISLFKNALTYFDLYGTNE